MLSGLPTGNQEGVVAGLPNEPGAGLVLVDLGKCFTSTRTSDSGTDSGRGSGTNETSARTGDSGIDRTLARNPDWGIDRTHSGTADSGSGQALVVALGSGGSG